MNCAQRILQQLILGNSTGAYSGEFCILAQQLLCQLLKNKGGVVARCGYRARTVRARFNVFGLFTQLLPR